MSDLNKLREERSEMIKVARGLLDAAEKESRNLSDEESVKYDELMTEQADLKTRIEREERQQELERSLLAQQIPGGTPPSGGADPIDPAGGGGTNEKRISAALSSFFQGGTQVLSQNEARALQVTPDTAGGYLQAPEQFVNQLIQAVDDMVYIRQLATTFTVASAQSMGAPSLENDPADADWTTELGTGSEDSTMSFGKRSLTPHPLAKRLKISGELLRAVPSAEGLARTRLAYKFGITHEKAFLSGTGASQPLGVFTADDNGIGTARDVSTGNTTTSVTFDGLTEAKYTLKGQYWPRARWMAHRDFYKNVAKLKDGEGQYLWRESVRAGEPDRLMGLEAVMSEYAPNTFTTGLYVGILGDFSNYWIADSLDMQLQRLVELYAENNQVGLIGRMQSDGMPVLAEAFVRVKLA